MAEDDGEPVGMAVGESTTPSRFSDERALELSGVALGFTPRVVQLVAPLDDLGRRLGDG